MPLETRKTLDEIEYYMDGDELVLTYKGKVLSFRPLSSDKLIQIGKAPDFYDHVFDTKIKKRFILPWDRYIERKVKVLFFPIEFSISNHSGLISFNSEGEKTDEQEGKKELVNAVERISKKFDIDKKRALRLLIMSKNLIFETMRKSRLKHQKF